VNPLDDDFAATGYGFGTSGNHSLPARLLAWIGNAMHLMILGLPGLQGHVRNAKRVVHRMGLTFSQDAFWQVCTVNLLYQYLNAEKAPEHILVIGDGYGVLSALIHSLYPNARLYLADLGSVLFFQAYHLQRAFPKVPQAVTDEDDGVFGVFNFVPADHLETLPLGDFDLAVNIASMQEMAPAVTARYFTLLRERNTRLLYCCNRLEKRLVGGEITRFMDYPWVLGDEHLVDEPCPWHQWFFGLGSSPLVKLQGIPIPLMHRYDGQHWHRLTRLKENPGND
jgi:hypothetical protein